MLYLLINFVISNIPLLNSIVCATDSASAISLIDSIKIDISNIRSYAPKVFLDCDSCDTNYFKTEITFINYVRDRQEAQIHLLVIKEPTGSGGAKYTVSFLGQKDFSDLNYKMEYIAQSNATADEIRSGLAHIFKLGLMPYVQRTPLAKYISIFFQVKTETISVKDKWNDWVFKTTANGSLYEEETYQSSNFSGNIAISHITQNNKIVFGPYWNTQKAVYKISGKTITSSYHWEGADNLYVVGLNNHWSIGSWFGFGDNTYENEKFAWSISPAIEYNIFPYSESTFRQLRCDYSFIIKKKEYFEETIYDKLQELLFREEFVLSYSTIQRWGSANISLYFYNYLQDFSKNSLIFNTTMYFQLFKGFSFNISGSGSMLHDQIYLPKGGASEEEIILRRRQLATQYTYYVSMGISYTFGSIYSNIVNPRFGY